MPGYVARVEQGLRERWPQARFWVFGHMGDGNLHVLASPDGIDGDARERIERCVYGPLREAGEAVSAEHGIGFEKKAWLGLTRSPQEIEVMRTLKRALDPKNILNPDRIF
ncbi:MAG: hypothetical protein HS128_07375 [Ideonella sp.]|nr:hypothetical protein [Ideonella sp.]MCC7459537.1 hypothetical protein [Nitrospira sp.]